MSGGWTSWGDWSVCSQSCGNGLKTRTRTCSDPPPQYGGAPCQGKSDEEEECKVNVCPGKCGVNKRDCLI